MKSIEVGPWGLPYRLVLNKLRGFTTTLMENMPSHTLNKVLDSLFPGHEVGVATGQEPEETNWNEDLAITLQEVYRAIRGMKAKNTASGPDGIKGLAWRKVLECTMDSIDRCLNACLKEGTFPANWKKAKLALLPKGSESGIERSIPNVRPICLLNDIGKAFERIIVGRIESWLAKNPHAALSENQYEFRKVKSTCDALIKVRTEIQRAVENGEVAIAVSIDIANAFNSLPWPKIHDALRDKGFPFYIRRIMRGYLSNRWIEFIASDGKTKERAILAGVPQGSILSPLL